jgi:glycosyltransferase involved in cell wall biosynthesis
MTKPLISICIPTYNGEQYLAECINSCLNQTFTDYEIIICDDGSNDKTISIIESYKNPKIKLFKNKENLGLVGNWNKCIDLSSGQWIKFVFQDDFITSDCLEVFASAIEEKDQIITSKRNFILPEKASDDYVNYYSKEVRTLENTSANKTDYFSPKLISKIAIQNMCMNFIGEPSLMMFRKSAIDKLGLFNASLKQICDLEFALRLSSNFGLKYIPKQVCAFRVHANSTTSNNVSNKFFELHYIEPILFSYLLLFDLQFASLRKQLTIVHLTKLRLYFKVKVYRAALVNKNENHQHYLFTDKNKTFPEIALQANPSWFIKLLANLL